jgi:DNA-binding XRE family transcriptional regulator
MQVGDAADRRGGFGEQLCRDRAAAGLTQEELAERSGLSVRAISDMECGRTSRPRHSTLRQITQALKPAAPEHAVAPAHDAVAGALPWQPLAQLPADLADFTGRSDQVGQLTSLLAAAGDGEPPAAVAVSAVAGAGGIGKAALAVHIAHRTAAQFPDGQIYLNLRGSSVSYASVRPAEATGGEAPDRAFRMLALAGGPDISLPAAAALLGLSPGQAEPALELQSAAAGRYQFHDLLTVYAMERAEAEEDAADREQAARRMLRWYLHTAFAAACLVNRNRNRLHLGPAEPGSAPLTFASYAQALAWLDTEYANLVAAVRQAVRQGEHELAWKLPAVLAALFFLRGHADDWIATHQIGLASARLLGDTRAVRWMLNNLGCAYFHAKRPEAAIDCHRQCLPIVRAAGNRPTLAMTLGAPGGSTPALARRRRDIHQARPPAGGRGRRPSQRPRIR